jgi:hypothetical protein
MSSNSNIPDFDSMSPEEMIAWMESLAKRQGADSSGFTTAADLDIEEIDPDTVDQSVVEQGYIPEGWTQERWDEQLSKEEAEKRARLQAQEAPSPADEQPVQISPPTIDEDESLDFATVSPDELMVWMESFTKQQMDDDVDSQADIPEPLVDPDDDISDPIHWLEGLAIPDEDNDVPDLTYLNDELDGVEDSDSMKWLASLANDNFPLVEDDVDEDIEDFLESLAQPDELDGDEIDSVPDDEAVDILSELNVLWDDDDEQPDTTLGEGVNAVASQTEQTALEDDEDEVLYIDDELMPDDELEDEDEVLFTDYALVSDDDTDALSGDLDIPDWLADADDVDVAEVPDWLTDTGNDHLVDSVLPEPELHSIVAPAQSASPVTADEPDNTPLQAAQEKVRQGDLEGALKDYEDVIRASQALDDMVSDLQALSQRAPYNTTPAVYRLLGDALMRKGDLQDALDAYRYALGLL